MKTSEALELIYNDGLKAYHNPNRLKGLTSYEMEQIDKYLDMFHSELKHLKKMEATNGGEN